MDLQMCIIASKVLRRLGHVPLLEVVLESPGGDLDSAIKLTKILRAHCDKLSVVVPFYAKSAASILAIGADYLVMTPYAEIGPVDPQVPDPQTEDSWVPAHSISRALEFIEGSRDKVVKLALTDKLSPLLIGAYREIEVATEQEVAEFCQRLPDGGKKATEALTTKYLSHSYPVTQEILKDLGFAIESLTLDQSEPFMVLHDEYTMITHMHGHHEGSCLIPDLAQTKDYQVGILNGSFVGERLHPTIPMAAQLAPGATSPAPPPVG